MSLWKLGIWLLTTVGVVGTIALIALFPVVAGGVFRGIMRFFSLVLSYRLGCALLSAILVGLVVDYLRHSHDDDVYAARVAAFEQAQKARDASIAADTRKTVEAELATATSENAETDKEVKEFHDELPPVPFTAQAGNPFRVGDASCRLRHIVGQAGCGPESTQGVPAARRTSGTPIDKSRFRLPRPRPGSLGTTPQGKST